MSRQGMGPLKRLFPVNVLSVDRAIHVGHAIVPVVVIGPPVMGDVVDTVVTCRIAVHTLRLAQSENV